MPAAGLPAVEKAHPAQPARPYRRDRARLKSIRSLRRRGHGDEPSQQLAPACDEGLRTRFPSAVARPAREHRVELLMRASPRSERPSRRVASTSSTSTIQPFSPCRTRSRRLSDARRHERGAGRHGLEHRARAALVARRDEADVDRLVRLRERVDRRQQRVAIGNAQPLEPSLDVPARGAGEEERQFGNTLAQPAGRRRGARPGP